MENIKQSKISTPVAIIVAGILIMVGILLTGGDREEKVVKEKTLSEQVGVSKEELSKCIAATDTSSLSQKIQTSVDKAMKAVPNDQRGTPYAIVIGSNGVMAEIKGADSYENVKKTVDDVVAGTVAQKYTGEVVVTEEGDHLYGNPNASVKIIEYSDFECPYCKIFHATLAKTVAESGGEVSWVYRHWPIHQNSFSKLVAAECVSQIKGNDAFWEYSDLLFGLLKTEETPAVSEQL